MTLREAVDAGMDQIAHLPIDGEADAPEVRELVAFLKERGTVVDPTQSWNELLGRSSETPIATFQPGFPKVPYPVRALFDHAGGDDVDVATARKRLLRSLGVVRALRAAGVPIVAGPGRGPPGPHPPRGDGVERRGRPHADAGDRSRDRRSRPRARPREGRRHDRAGEARRPRGDRRRSARADFRHPEGPVR